jgi:hypothetical protein
VYLLTIVLLYYHTLPLQCAVTLIAKMGNFEQKTIISLILNGGLLAFAFFCNKYYNAFYELFSETLWWVFPIFSLILPLLSLLLLIGEKRTATKNRKSKKEVLHAR